MGNNRNGKVYLSSLAMINWGKVWSKHSLYTVAVIIGSHERPIFDGYDISSLLRRM